MVDPYVDFLNVLNEIMGTPRFTVIVPLIPFFVPEYGYIDKINHTRGLIETFNVVYPQLEGLDFKEQAAELQVPVYFFVGRHDVNAMASLVEEYYNALTAPDIPWNLVIWNDPVTLMSYVSYVVQCYCGYSDTKANTVMLEVHT